MANKGTQADTPNPPTIDVVASGATPAPLSLPSANINHASVYEAEAQARLAGFESGIIALQGEVEGRETEFLKERDRLRSEFERKTDELTVRHGEFKASLLNRIDDLQVGKAMASAALDVFSESRRALRKEGEAA